MNQNRQDVPPQRIRNRISKKNSLKNGNNRLQAYLKKQNDIVGNLKTELKMAKTLQDEIKLKLSEQIKNKKDLEKRIETQTSLLEKRDAELLEAKDGIVKTANDFTMFKEQYFVLEKKYDQIIRMKCQEIQQLSETHAKQLEEREQTIAKLRLDLDDINKNFENMKKQQEADKILNEEKINQEKKQSEDQLQSALADLKEKLNEELKEKDGVILELIAAKQKLENEKNQHISELKNKINQIGNVVSLPNKQVAGKKRSQSERSISTETTANETKNVGVSKPQLRRNSLAVASEEDIENQPTTSLQTRSQSSFVNPNSLNEANTSRATLNLRNAPPARRIGFSSTSSDDDDLPIWRPPNRNHTYVPETETDASVGFMGQTSKRRRI